MKRILLRGALDETYLARIDAAVAQAKANNLYVVLEWICRFWRAATTCRSKP